MSAGSVPGAVPGLVAARGGSGLVAVPVRDVAVGEGDDTEHEEHESSDAAQNGRRRDERRELVLELGKIALPVVSFR